MYIGRAVSNISIPKADPVLISYGFGSCCVLIFPWNADWHSLKC